MHTPRVETIKVSWFPKGTFRDEEQWTGLPRALHLQTTLTTPDEAAALVALLRAAVRPAPDVAKRLEDAYDEDIMEASMYMSVPDFARTHYLRFAAGKLKGLPGVTFVWRWDVAN